MCTGLRCLFGGTVSIYTSKESKKLLCISYFMTFVRKPLPSTRKRRFSQKNVKKSCVSSFLEPFSVCRKSRRWIRSSKS